ncbi:MAG: NADH-quinone oxidoreductase subunit M [Bacteroidetes bacterium]|nr:NADH-quinone oxidoreductase subunit M [Bacteroidota bacterium]
MITLLILLLPLVAGILIYLGKKENAYKLTLAFSLLELLVVAIGVYVFKTQGESSLAINYPWIKSIGTHFNIAINGLNVLLVLLTGLLLPIIVYSTANRITEKTNLFYALVLFMQFALQGVFMARDGFLFYIFWELALLPIWFICLLWSEENRTKTTFKFFVYTLTGSLFMLASLIYLYVHTSNGSFAIEDLYTAGKSLSVKEQRYIFWGMFIAFAIKMPVFPFHTWQPDTYTNAPTAGTMLLSGIMLKMGTYGLIVWLLPLAPAGVEKYAYLAITLSIIGIIYGSSLALVQKDFKRLIAYSSFAHVGLMSAGILTCNSMGVQGSIIQMFSHGINVVGLFLVVDIFQRNTGTRTITSLGGLRNIDGLFAFLFLVILLGSVALPLTSGFVGEFLLLNSIYQYNSVMAVFAGLTVILGAVYMLRSYQSIMLGEVRGESIKYQGMTSNEKISLIIISILIIVLGVYPNILMSLSEGAVMDLVNSVK